jgi:hypothetical protein
MNYSYIIVIPFITACVLYFDEEDFYRDAVLSRCGAPLLLLGFVLFYIAGGRGLAGMMACFSRCS